MPRQRVPDRLQSRARRRARSNRPNTIATGTTIAAATPSHSGRVAHHSRLIGSGSGSPKLAFATRLRPARAMSTGMCHR